MSMTSWSIRQNDPKYVCYAYCYNTPRGVGGFGGECLATDFKELYAVAEDMRSHGVPVPANVLAAINPKPLQQICRETVELHNYDVSALPETVRQQLFPPFTFQSPIHHDVGMNRNV